MKMNGKCIIINYKGLFMYAFLHVNSFGNGGKRGSRSVILVIIADKKENSRFYYCSL
jgi:hypothetical protein